MTWQASGYRHRLELGGGATGRAVLAVHEATGELVVIKYLHVEEAFYTDVRAEIENVSTLDSTYFVRIREFVEADEGIAVVMDPVNGGPMRTLLRDHGALGPEAALALYRDSLAALAAGHAADIVHGDYRPENVLVARDGTSALVDTRMAAWIHRDVNLSTGVYLAPERWHGGELTASADVYAATVTFVEVIAGEPPYWEESQLLALRYQHEQGELPDASVPPALRDLIRIGMAKDAAARLDAASLVAMIDMVAVAEYGGDWESRGRTMIAERVDVLALAFGGPDEIDAAGVYVGDVEDAALDDYYADAAVGVVAVGVAEVADTELLVESETIEVDGVAEVDAIGVAAVGALGVAAVEVDAVEVDAVEVAAVEVAAVEVDEVVDGAGVVMAAEDIVAVARIQEETEAAALAAAAEEELTEEEELAVAEVESIVAMDAIAGAEAAAAEEDDDATGAVLVGVGAGALLAGEPDETDVVTSTAMGGLDDTDATVAGVSEEELDVVETDEQGVGAAAVAGGVVAAGVLGAIGADLVTSGAAGASTAGGLVGATIGSTAMGGLGEPGVGGAVGGSASGGGAPGAGGGGSASGGGVPPAGAGGGSGTGGGTPPTESWVRRHPWWSGFFVLVVILACVGGGLIFTGNGTNDPVVSPTPVASTEPGQIGGSSPSPTDAGSPSVTPPVSPSPSATSPSPSPSPSMTHKPKPSPSESNPCENPNLQNHGATRGADGGAADQPYAGDPAGVADLRC